MVQLTVTVAKNYTNVKLPGQQHAIEQINLMHRGQIGAPDLDPCYTGLSSAMSFSGLCKERETFTLFWDHSVIQWLYVESKKELYFSHH